MAPWSKAVAQLLMIGQLQIVQDMLSCLRLSPVVLLAAYWLVRKVEKAAPSSTPAVAGVYTCPAQCSVAA